MGVPTSCVIAAGLAVLVAAPAPAAAPFAPAHLTRDINTTPVVASSQPRSFLSVGPLVYFFATDDRTGQELWRTDGSAAGTFRVADLTPGEPGSDDRIAAVLAGDVIAGGGGVTWRSDGTVEGTAPISGGPPYSPAFAAEIEGITYYFDDDGVHGTELWRSDGSASGTWQVADLNPNGSISPQHAPVAAGGQIFFLIVPDARRGALELWKTDGTAAGTRLVRDVTTTPIAAIDAPAAEMVALGDQLIFSTSLGVIWSSDGRADGTRQLRRAHSGVAELARELTVVGDRVVFVATGDAYGEELWITDGTFAGTRLVADLEPGPVGSHPAALRALGDEVFFRATRSDVGMELWRTDGTSAGTVLVADLVHQPGRGSTCVQGFGETLALAGGYFFFAQRADEACGLWRADAATGAVTRLADVGGDGQLAALGTRVVFAGNDGAQTEPWISDGTPAGTALLRDVRMPTLGSSPFSFVGTRFGALFVANDASDGGPLWRSDGTAAGTIGLTDLPPGALSDLLDVPADLGYLALFASTEADGRWLWSTAGTSASTVRLRRLRGVRLSGFSVIDDSAYFADDGDLWLSDGTERGTRLVKPAIYPTLLRRPAVLEGTLYFPAFGLARTDGTADGTYVLTESTTWLGSVPEIVTAGRRVFFTGTVDGLDLELWQTDGTRAGTGPVLDINPGSGPLGVPNSSSPHHLTALANRLLFFADDGVHGQEPWITDGSAEGTHLLRDIRAGAEGSLAWGSRDRWTLSLGPLALFVADSSGAGFELWRSDGTAGGTYPLTDVVNPDRLTAVGSLALFIGDGRLWRSDGTVAGTYPVLTFAPQQRIRITSSEAGPLAIAGDAVFFALDDLEHGSEPWTVSLAAALCWGDVGHDRAVHIDELLAGVNAALGSVGDDVLRAFDSDGDGRVAVGDLILAVRSATEGCTR